MKKPPEYKKNKVQSFIRHCTLQRGETKLGGHQEDKADNTDSPIYPDSQGKNN